MLGIDLKSGRQAWTYALVGLAIYGAYTIRKTLLMFVIALMVAYLVYPLVEVVDRRLPWKSRVPAVVVPFVLFAGLVAGFMFVVKPTVRTEIQDFQNAQKQDPSFKSRLANSTVWGVPVGRFILEKVRIRETIDTIPQLKTVPGIAARELEHLFVIPILTFLFLLDGPRIRDNAMEMLFGEGHGIALSEEGRLVVESILRDAHVMILEYMRALLFLCVATLVAFGIALKGMGVPYATLLALFACPLEFLPLVGPLLSAIVIIVVSGLDMSGTANVTGLSSHGPHLIWVIVFLGGYRIFQDYVLSPHLMQKGVKLHPLLVIFGIFAGGEIGGVGGIFLSVPILALARLVYYEWRRRRSVLTLMAQEVEVSMASV